MPYSTNLYTGPASAELMTLYTVPAGYVAVVRDVEYFNSSGDTIDDLYVVAEVPGPLAATFAYVASLASNAGAQWQGRVVVPAAGFLEVGAYGSGLLLIVSGYLLSSP